ncbi:MAG: MIP/aquaporin family protein [Anaeroplasma sp.]
MNNLLKRCIVEAFGTGILVFCACGVAGWCGNNPVAISLSFGLVIVAVAFSVGSISGCHINPAVSLAMFIRKKLSMKEFFYYVLAQVAGGFAGAFILAACMRSFDKLGANTIQIVLYNSNGNLDAWSYIGAFFAEIILTFIFVITVIGVTDEKNQDCKYGPIIIGLALVLVHLIGLGLTGTSVNPARSIAPSVLTGIFGNATGHLNTISQLWIWILGPLCGGSLAAITYNLLVES